MPWSTEQKRIQAKLKHTFSSEEFSLLGWRIFRFKILTLHHHVKQFLGCTADEDCHLQAARVGSDVSQAYTVSSDCRAVSSACSSSLWRPAHCLSLLWRRYCIVQYCCSGSSTLYCFCHTQNYTAAFIHGHTHPRNPSSMTTAKPLKHLQPKPKNSGFGWIFFKYINQNS